MQRLLVLPRKERRKREGGGRGRLVLSTGSQAARVSRRALSTLVHGWLTAHVAPWVRLVRCNPSWMENTRRSKQTENSASVAVIETSNISPVIRLRMPRVSAYHLILMFFLCPQHDSLLSYQSMLTYTFPY